MNSHMLKLVLAASLMLTGFVGCGPETAIVLATATQAATAAGAVAGTVWVVKSIENVSLDTEKKKLELEAIHRGN